MQKKTKNIIFDFGGVILNIDYQLTIDAFKEIGMNNFDTAYSQASQIHLFDNLEKGLISPEQFRDGIRLASGLDLSDEKIDYAWNKIILDLPKQRIDLILKIRNNYNCFLLSNTNTIHYDLYIKQLQNFGINSFDDVFLKAYFSFEMGMRKPDAEIFEFVLKQESLNAEETLFIDDSIQHIEAAQKLGINSYHLKNKVDITLLFDENNKLIISY